MIAAVALVGKVITGPPVRRETLLFLTGRRLQGTQ